jgi:hypothetical protein
MFSMIMWPNKIIGANPGGPGHSPLWTHWATRVAQFWRWASREWLYW